MRSRISRSVLLAVLMILGLVASGNFGPASAGHLANTPEYFPLDVLPAPTVTGKKIVDDLATFANGYPLRITGTPVEIAAAEYIRGKFASFGLEAKIEDLPTRSGTPNGPVLKVVTGMKRGTSMPDEWIVLMGHYDTIASTIYGAYDNGAGTNLIIQLAEQLSKVPTSRSIVFALYNGEEEGLLASAQHAAILKAAGQQITSVLGFDMVGIGWPVGTTGPNNCLCMFHGSTDGAWAKPLLEHVNFGFLGFPKKNTEVWVQGANTRNSDERSFANQGYRSLRWSGMRSASHYRAYHLPDDTMETIYDVAGGRSFFEQGSLNTLKSAYYTALALDHHLPVPMASHTASGLTASFDGSGSSDLDGPVSELRWDFGDGATAVGATASHTYAAPGTYTVTLTAADNLVPSVTRSTTLNVTVG